MTAAKGQNSHLTYKANRDIGRHGWLRLTPAYSVRLVREHIAELGPDSVVTDPFSGTGTTALAAAEHGVRGQAFDINPFLIWLGRAKTRHYNAKTLATASAYVAGVVTDARDLYGQVDLWQPRLANIHRWWGPGVLAELRALRAALDSRPADPARDLLDIAFCRALIAASDASFSHQSMSFKTPKSPMSVGLMPPTPPGRRARSGGVAPGDGSVTALFVARAEEILASAAVDLPGDARIIQGDSRGMTESTDLIPCDLLLTSPPYVNRMSYIRELRPYMYWLRYLDEPSDASNLDWTAIGGTWGTATSRLTSWEPVEESPIASLVEPVCGQIVRDGGKSGPLLANYVRKYFADMWPHFQAAYKHVRSGGQASYIVGNSSFYGNLVPAQEWYRLLLGEAGFGPVSVSVIRKRNSNKELWEFDVTAQKL